MKNKILCYLLSFCLIILCCSFIAGCKENNIPQVPQELTITNYENYDSVAVGFSNNVSQTTNIKSSRLCTPILANNTSEKHKTLLIGRKKDGTYEKIKFKENSSLETYSIKELTDLGKFVLFIYTSQTVYEINTNICGWPSVGEYAILLDKTTGKMYNITDYRINAPLMNYGVSADSFFAGINRKIFRFSTIENVLKVEEVIDTEKIPVFSHGFVCDKYNNLYSVGNANNRFIVTSQGKIKPFTGSIAIAANGIAYLTGSIPVSQWFNKDGNIEEASFIPESFINPIISNGYYKSNTHLIYQEEKNYYYYYANYYDIDGIRYDHIIIKCTFIDDVQYEISTISPQDPNIISAGVVKDKIYFLSASEIYYINLRDKTRKEINSNYIFGKLYTDNQGDIIFEGVDEYLNDVIGLIDYTNDTVSIGVTQKQYEVSFVLPLN